MRKSIPKLLFLLLIVVTGCIKQEDKIRPNIVFILVDDLGKEWISCYGAEDIQTPNIDHLAENGIRFNNVYGMPQCTPTRVTLLTGQYPYRHGWVNHWDVPRWGGGAHFDETKNPTLGNAMKQAGYKTCIAGKWQIDDFRIEPDALTKCGFDEFCVWTGYETGNPPSAERYFNPYIFTNNGAKTYTDTFGPDVFKTFITRFIHANKDTSMFIYYPMVLTHPPLTDTPDESAPDLMGKHKAMVRYMDKITGEIVNALDEVGVRKNTIIIWTTNNGTSNGIIGTLNGREINGGKSKTTEAGVCLPFIASWPGTIDSNKTSDALIDFSDIFPTFLDLAGVETNGEWTTNNHTYAIDGESFKSVLLDKTKDSSHEWILSMGGGNNARLTENGVENQYVFRDRVIRNKRYKLCINDKRQPDRFYDLLVDPDEKNNIIDSLNTPGRKENFTRLAKAIETFPLADAEPRYVPNPKQPWDVEITAQSKVWKK
jgi:arylsulfatase A-like enzyme